MIHKVWTPNSKDYLTLETVCGKKIGTDVVYEFGDQIETMPDDYRKQCRECFHIGCKKP